MTNERRVRSLLLGYFVAPAWLLLAAFVALNLIQSSFTSFCPAAKLLGGSKSNGVSCGAQSS